jgi:hypothetical protein
MNQNTKYSSRKTSGTNSNGSWLPLAVATILAASSVPSIAGEKLPPGTIQLTNYTFGFASSSGSDFLPNASDTDNFEVALSEYATEISRSQQELGPEISRILFSNLSQLID